MNNNPLAKVIRDAFIENVISRPAAAAAPAAADPTAAILRHKRIFLFERAVNKFLINSGEAPLPPLPENLDEKNLLTFSLQLSGYIRDAQPALDRLTAAQACDPDLINLYQAAAGYSVACNHQIDGSKYVFREHCDYQLWKLRLTNGAEHVKFNNHGFIINPKHHNLLLAMPFHIRDTQEDLQNWTFRFLNHSLDNSEIFGSRADVFLAHFPIEQPRGEKFALSLQTISRPEDFFTAADMRFVSQNLAGFLGSDIRTDEQNRICGGCPFDNETFKNNLRNLTIVSYCAGAAHAHRWVNALDHLASQLYDRQTVKDGLQNIFVISYAFLPIQQHSKYSGVHFMSNYADDTLRKEPFIKMFNPELYEAVKYRPSPLPVRVTVMPDDRNRIIACNLPADFAVRTADGGLQPLTDIENGHHMGLITAPNANSNTDIPFKLFKNIVENATIGRRGREVFQTTGRAIGSLSQPLAVLHNYRRIAAKD